MFSKEELEKINNYFSDLSGGCGLMLSFIIVGIILIINDSIGIGSTLILIGIIIAFFASNKSISDEEFDALVQKAINELKKDALNKTSIDESELVGKQLVITGPRFFGGGGAEFKYKKGNDNLARYTPIDVFIINLTENQIITYRTSLNMLSGKNLNTNTDEYFYKDVVSISTKTIFRTYKIEDKKLAKELGGKNIELNEAETFSLTTSGGTSVEIILRDPKLTKLMGEIPTIQSEKTIQSVRKMLRDKKTN